MVKVDLKINFAVSRSREGWGGAQSVSSDNLDF